MFEFFFSLQTATQGPPAYQQVSHNGTIAAKRFKPGDEGGVVQQRPPVFLNQQQLQMLQYLQQNHANLNPQQQSMLHQLTQQYRIMQQYKAMQAQTAAARQYPQQQQQQQQQGPFQPSLDGQRTPTSGTVAQTGFVSDGSFSPATGHTQQAAGMPFKSAATGYPQQQQQQFNATNNQQQAGFTQISSTTQGNSTDLGKFIKIFDYPMHSNCPVTSKTVAFPFHW